MDELAREHSSVLVSASAPQAAIRSATSRRARGTSAGSVARLVSAEADSSPCAPPFTASPYRWGPHPISGGTWAADGLSRGVRLHRPPWAPAVTTP